MEIELIIQHENTIYAPVVLDDVTWQTERKGVAGELRFSVKPDGKLNFHEGDGVRFSVDGTALFYGFVFTKKRDKDGIIAVTAYDQLRYLKNKDTYVFENMTASGILRRIATDFQLQVGELAETPYIIPSLVEENTTLFDMLQEALELTVQHKNQLFVLYDDVGKLSLQNIASLIVPMVIDSETGVDFSYTSTIDEETYNQVKLTYDNDETGTREIYMAQDSSNINQWGVLQYFDTLDDGENGAMKAEALLELYNKKVRNLSISSAFGDVRVRAGSMLVVQLDLGDMIMDSLMLVEKCTHSFSENLHTMDLRFVGGEFHA